VKIRRWLTLAGLVIALAALHPHQLPAMQCPDGSPPPCAGSRTPPVGVAVLPFANLSPDSADVYLADGLTEELISRLGSVERLRVPGRTMAQRARTGTPGPDVLGRRLGVPYLVEGSVRRGPGRVRISVRLLRASDGTRLWGDDYDRRDADLLDIQGDIAREVAANVAGRLLPEERSRLAARPTRSATAWDHYLRGNHALGTRSARSLAIAVTEYQRALTADSSFVAAEARTAYAYAMGTLYGIEGIPADSAAARGERSAQRALALDPGSSDAWMAWGWLRSSQNTRSALDEYRTAMRRAVRLDPRNAEAWHQVGQAETWLDDDAAAIAAYERALALEPGRAQTMYELSLVHSFAGRWTTVLRLTDSAIAESPQHARSHVSRSRARLALGDTAGAGADAQRAIELSSGVTRFEALAVDAAAAAALGDTLRLQGDVATLAAEPARPAPVLQAILLSNRAAARLAARDRDGAIAALESVPPSALFAWMLRYPDFDGLRDDPRFQGIAATARASP